MGAVFDPVVSVIVEANSKCRTLTCCGREAGQQENRSVSHQDTSLPEVEEPVNSSDIDSGPAAG